MGFKIGNTIWKGKKQSPEHIAKRLANRLYIVSDATRLKMSLISKGRVHSEETKLKMSISHKGRVPHAFTEETRKKMSAARLGKKCSFTPLQMAKVGLRTRFLSGELHPNWRGGVTSLNKRLRHSSEFAEWRTKVFQRDNYTCQDCGIRGAKLHPDHIKPFAYFPKLRFELSNGKMLCESCHKKTPTYGGGAVRIYGRKTLTLV